ncbi:5-deoxy-glucuronate isomerase [Agreia sp. PsM10]|uniref:5-deoxy-glucuronate isomerase n=1 Tax=Agreia sp. PsM10 TaxID=3030533 RepID=UPI00263B1BE5|nr:5-deoxy-glucuronate isomerase [Agreia sp. PsM10]MDN4640811.1 5-deoxy-glucuronate isomerase [Agreia sp. PsM10]
MQRRNEWMFPRGDLREEEWESVVDSSLPGWKHTGLRVADLREGDELDLPAEGLERIVVPLSGGFTVQHQGAGPAIVSRLEGRASVFDGPTDVLYLSTVSSATVSGVGRVAIAEAPSTSVHPSRHIRRDEVSVELRGAGRSSRQVHNFGLPGELEADRLIVCEVITPAENWSSYPAHKHDEDVPGHESRLEEIYYFESAVSRGLHAPANAEPFGFFSTSSSPAGEIAIDSPVRTGDIALVPFGYHGPAIAAPGYDLYYLNVMAGPGDERAWLISDHPAHGWIRETWNDQDIDARLPYTRSTSEGSTHA